MAEIKPKYLPNPITIFNRFKDLDTGELFYYRTILENTRVDQAFVTFYDNNIGSIRKKTTKIFIDKKNTKAWHSYSDNKFNTKKIYAQDGDWKKLLDDQKHGYWTIQEKDWVFATIGELISVCDNYDKEIHKDQKFFADNRLHIISEIKPIFDKNGLTVYWEVTCD
jgi:hypothetical protein